MKTPTAELAARLAECEVQPGQHWRHYKGTLYYVQFVGLNESTLEPMIGYFESLRGQPVSYVRPSTLMVSFARPLSEWLETVTHGGRDVPRFTREE